MATLVLITSLMMCIGYSNTNCNYVVDLWGFQSDIQPPTLDPTPSPSPAPTNAPTYSPTFINETITTEFQSTQTQQQQDIQVSESGINNILLLNPATVNYCYNWGNIFGEPYNNFAIEYECNGYNLIRKIYWDTTECSDQHNDIDITEFDSSQTYHATTFLCGQSTNCNTLSLQLVSAETMSPTASPTAAPIIPPFNTTEQIQQPGSASSGFSNCSDIIGPDSTPSMDLEMTYTYGLCIEANILTMFNGSNWYFGWKCNDEGQYIFGIYNDTLCSILPDDDSFGELVYTNDSCIGSMWSYVDCQLTALTVDPTKTPTTVDPTKSPTTVDPTKSPTTVDPTTSPTENPTESPTENPTTVNSTKSPTNAIQNTENTGINHSKGKNHSFTVISYFVAIGLLWSLV